MDKNAPCYGCEKRWATSKDNCHSSCEDYKAFSRKRSDELSMKRMKTLEEKMMNDLKFETIRKATRTKNTQGCGKG